MSETVPSRLMRGSDDDAKVALETAYKANNLILSRYREYLEEKLEEKIRQDESAATYDSSNLDAKLHKSFGYRAALRDLLKLFPSETE